MMPCRQCGPKDQNGQLRRGLKQIGKTRYEGARFVRRYVCQDCQWVLRMTGDARPDYIEQWESFSGHLVDPFPRVVVNSQGGEERVIEGAAARLVLAQTITLERLLRFGTPLGGAEPPGAAEAVTEVCRHLLAEAVGLHPREVEAWSVQLVEGDDVNRSA